jgi:hypothetical protein
MGEYFFSHLSEATEMLRRQQKESLKVEQEVG